MRKFRGKILSDPDIIKLYAGKDIKKHSQIWQNVKRPREG